MRNFFLCLFCRRSKQRYQHLGMLTLTLAPLLLMSGHVYGKRIPMPYSEDDKEMILSLVEPSPVMASIKKASPLLTEPYLGARTIYDMQVSRVVEILMDNSEQWYFVQDKTTGRKGWISASCLDISENGKINTSVMNREQLECYVNISGLQSETEYLVWTDISRQLTHIFKGKDGAWSLVRTLICSTGKNSSPTVRGIFKIEERGSWFYSERLKSGAKYWVRFYGSYLYHSVAMDEDGNITDASLGKRQSNGCVRLSVGDAEWFYLSIPEGSAVFIY